MEPHEAQLGPRAIREILTERMEQQARLHRMVPETVRFEDRGQNFDGSATIALSGEQMDLGPWDANGSPVPEEEDPVVYRCPHGEIRVPARWTDKAGDK
jgi:hypothetical protein